MPEEPEPYFVRSSLLGTHEVVAGRTLLWHPLDRPWVDADEVLAAIIESSA